MGEVIRLNVPRSALCEHPKNIFKLRWRIELGAGVVISGDWTPKVRFPSLSMALREFADRIENVSIEGRNDGKIVTMLSCPGYAFANLTYKAAYFEEKTEVIGMELTDREGSSYLVRRDGTFYHEVKK